MMEKTHDSASRSERLARRGDAAVQPAQAGGDLLHHADGHHWG